MIVAVVLIGALLMIVLLLQRDERKAWQAERQLLLERIQAPERVRLIGDVEEQEPLETDGPGLALIGQIDDRPPIEA